MADRRHPVRPDVVPELPVCEPDAGIAVVAGVQGPHHGRRQVADVAEAQDVAGRQRAGRDTEHDERRRRRGKRAQAQTERLRGAHRVETVPDTGVLLPVAGGQRHLHNTVLRREFLSNSRHDSGQQLGVHRGRAAQAHHERHRLRVHTAPEPPHDGHDVRVADGRFDGRVRHVRVPVRRARRARPAALLGAAGVHPVQRGRQHAGHGAAAVDDDRRDVPAEGAGDNGRSGAVAGLFLHIRHGENIARPDDRPGDGPDHVAVRRRVRRGGVLRSGVPAGDPGQESDPSGKTVRVRRRGGPQGRRIPGTEFQIEQ